jgi:tocopherol cyclase
MASKISDPMRFQGNIKRKHYFEGWYFNQVSSACRKTIALIPGISLNPGDAHCFIQAIVSPPAQSYYFRFPVSSMKWSDNPFMLEIGDSRFGKTECIIRLSDETAEISGRVTFGPLTEISRHWWMPGIMGYFSYIPFMECSHGIVSMDHTVDGQITCNGEQLIFNNDRGYIEKDWGTSFPSSYVWIQANHFPEAGDSFMLSIASVPFLRRSFKGLITNLIHQGKEYRLATYNGTKILGESRRPEGVEIELQKGRLGLHVSARIETSVGLKAPRLGRMADVIKEGLGGSVTVALYDKGALLFEKTSPFAGIEIV